MVATSSRSWLAGAVPRTISPALICSMSRWESPNRSDSWSTVGTSAEADEATQRIHKAARSGRFTSASPSRRLRGAFGER